MRQFFKHDPDWRRARRAERAAFAAAPLPHNPQLKVHHFQFPVPAAGAGPRLLFFSDLHWNSHSAVGSEELVETINRTHPDWILFGGDLAMCLEHLEAALEVVQQLRANHGKLAVLGNWERRHDWLRAQFWRDVYRGAGFELLCNEVKHPVRPNDPLFLGFDDGRWGITDPTCGEGVAGTDRFTVGLLHSPETAGDSTGFFLGHLLLAGHTHAGQLRLPWFGALHTSTPYWKQFEYGWYHRERDRAWMYVSAGVGLSGFPMLQYRLFCPAEIVVIDLVAAVVDGAG